MKKDYTLKTSTFKIVSFFLFLLPSASFAAISVQEQCYATLQSNLSEITQVKAPLKVLQDMKYSELDGKFSKYYKNISSFGIDIDSPDFDMRIYSFGRQTGYQHPPFSPFPTYSKSDKWDAPAKEYIVAEEYVRNSSTGERVFLSCAFMQIAPINIDIKSVTAEQYLYDGEPLSLLRSNPKENYKAWYTENMSYNHTNRPFVNWYRLFIYPQATKNTYFDRYQIADAFPSNKVTDFKVLNIPETSPVQKKNSVKPDGANMLINLKNEDGAVVASVSKYRVLMPVVRSGEDSVFALNSYYQAIEDVFPDFSKKLAIRGVIHYDIVKELLSTKGNPAFSVLWGIVLDPRDITKYALAKKNGLLKKHDPKSTVLMEGEINPFFEEQLKKINSLTFEDEAKKLLVTNPVTKNTDGASGDKGKIGSKFYTFKMIHLLYALFSVIILLSIYLVYFFAIKRKVRLAEVMEPENVKK